MGDRERDMIGVKAPDRGRFYCHYEQLEDYKAGMWRRVSSESSKLTLIALAVSLLRDAERFRAALAKVLRDWPTSCRVELTRSGRHLAWLGAAACCLQHGVPEELTRRAWWKLTDGERLQADECAAEAESCWREAHA